MTTRQEQLAHPTNFVGADGALYLVRCVACGGSRGTENYMPAVASGYCAWCGWGSPCPQCSGHDGNCHPQPDR